MQKRQFTVNATGAALSLGLGFHPDYVKVLNLTTKDSLEWWKLGTDGQRFGLVHDHAGATPDTFNDDAAASAAYGIILYNGSAPLVAASTTELVLDDSDHKGTITTWTLTTAANKTGKFNVALDTAICGVGSKVQIGKNLYEIVALSNDGDANDDVTLDVAAPSAGVDKITSMFRFRGASADVAVPKGITIGASAIVNNANDTLLVVAELHDA